MPEPPAIPPTTDKGDMTPAADVMRTLVPWTANALRGFIDKRPQEFDKLPPQGLYGQAPLAIRDDNIGTLLIE